jgi:hypothetical protein
MRRISAGVRPARARVPAKRSRASQHAGLLGTFSARDENVALRVYRDGLGRVREARFGAVNVDIVEFSEAGPTAGVRQAGLVC